MAIEIERKFLILHSGFLKGRTGTAFKQGYLNREGATVRVRIAGKQAFLTIKGKSQGISRAEYEYAVPINDATEMLTNLCTQPIIKKMRYLIKHAGNCWEVDVFQGENQGLIVAEIELKTVNETFEKPDWLGQEVSHEPRYFNSQLAKHPYSQWPENGDDK